MQVFGSNLEETLGDEMLFLENFSLLSFQLIFKKLVKKLWEKLGNCSKDRYPIKDIAEEFGVNQFEISEAWIYFCFTIASWTCLFEIFQAFVLGNLFS